MRGMFSGSRAGTKLEFVTSDLRYSNPWKFKGRFFQIPPDLVVKSQIIDIIGFIMPLMQEKTLVHTSPRPRRSRCEPLSRSEGCWFTTKSAGMWNFLDLLRSSLGLMVYDSNPAEDLAALAFTKKADAEFQLDFDDALHYATAKKHHFTLVSFDQDFDRTDLLRQTPADILAFREGTDQ
jgi:uncharacterized protein with PIN domain